jgi:hypothetical protein
MCCGQKRTELKNSQTQRIVQGGAQYARNNQGQSPGNQPATPSAVYPLDQPTDAWCTRPGDPSRFHQRSLSGEFCDPGARVPVFTTSSPPLALFSQSMPETPHLC